MEQISLVHLPVSLLLIALFLVTAYFLWSIPLIQTVARTLRPQQKSRWWTLSAIGWLEGCLVMVALWYFNLYLGMAILFALSLMSALAGNFVAPLRTKTRRGQGK